MANGEMEYKGERESDSFTIPAGGSYVYIFTDTYRKADVFLDTWNSKTKPTVTITNTQVTVAGAEGDTGKLTVIEK